MTTPPTRGKHILRPSTSSVPIISCSSSSVRFSPSSFATRFRFRKEMPPVLSSSKREKTFAISSRSSRFSTYWGNASNGGRDEHQQGFLQHAHNNTQTPNKPTTPASRERDTTQG